MKSNRLQCDHAGWFHCKFTQTGFNMEGEGEVLYSTVLQDSDCPVPANYYQAGPVYDIKCVQGELSQLRLPHCETSIEDAHHFMSVIHYSNEMIDILKPQNITSTHITVSIPGTSTFFISKMVNWFTDHWSKTLGQVMLFYLQQAHRLHVFLKPRNVDPREVEKCNKDYKLIQTACECMLKFECVYSMSCDPIEEHGPSVRPRIQPMDTKLHCTKQWKHYYPTFDIKLPDGVMNVDLHLKQKNPKKGKVEVVWSRDISLTDYTAENSRPSLSTKEQCASFLKNNKAELIQRVRNVDVILDHLADVIANEQIDEIREMTTSQRKMRRIFDIIETQGFLSEQKFLEVLYKEEPALMEDMTADNN